MQDELTECEKELLTLKGGERGLLMATLVPRDLFERLYRYLPEIFSKDGSVKGPQTCDMALRRSVRKKQISFKEHVLVLAMNARLRALSPEELLAAVAAIPPEEKQATYRMLLRLTPGAETVN